MIQTPTKIAITFQSTSLKASVSDITPAQTMMATPISAASVLSIQLVMTTKMVSANTIRVNHCIGSICPSFQEITGLKSIAY